MKYNKLVRDRIPELIEESGRKQISRTLNEDEYEQALMDKIVEEIEEYRVSKNEEEIADIYNQYEVDKSPENFVNRIKEFNKTSTSVGRLVSYIMLLKNVEGLDLTGEKDHIIAAVDDVIHILNSLDFSKGLGTVCDMVDILYSIQQDYFEKYQVDVLDGRVNKLNEIVSKLNEIMKEYYNAELKKINEEIPDDAKPEDVGMLDVTKYKGVADDNTPNQK